MDAHKIQNEAEILRQKLIEKLKTLSLEELKVIEGVLNDLEDECPDVEEYEEEEFSSQESSIFTKEYYLDCYNPRDEI